MRLTLVAAAAGFLVGCHHAPSSFGPNKLRTEAECAPVIARVRADTSVANAPRASQREVFIPGEMPPPTVMGHTAVLWVPVDQHGRVRASDIRVSGIPDAKFVRVLQRTTAKERWNPAVIDGCWVPSWGYLTFSFR